MNTLFCNIGGCFSLVAAAYILINNKEGWGWFLFAALMLFGGPFISKGSLSVTEWPHWIKEALLKKPKEEGRIFREDEQTLYLTTSNDLLLVPAGRYLVWSMGSIYIDTFENLSQYYDRLSSLGRPVELKRFDALAPEEETDDDGLSELDSTKPARKR